MLRASKTAEKSYNEATGLLWAHINHLKSAATHFFEVGNIEKM